MWKKKVDKKEVEKADITLHSGGGGLTELNKFKWFVGFMNDTAGLITLLLPLKPCLSQQLPVIATLDPITAQHSGIRASCCWRTGINPALPHEGQQRGHYSN